MKTRGLIRRIGLGSACLIAATGAFSSAAGAEEEPITATFIDACTSVEVTSIEHDLSNVVLDFEDGDQKIEGLTGDTGTFSGTGESAGDTLLGVWVKAGNNMSDDGPGYGDYFSATDCGQPTNVGGTDDDNDNGGGRDDDSVNDNGDDDADGSGDALVGATFNCDNTSVAVTSTKDISNIVLVLSTGEAIKHEGLSGTTVSFSAPDGTTFVAVYVKSGSNLSGDGPGYGERIDAPAPSCDEDTTNNSTDSNDNDNENDNDSTSNENTSNNGSVHAPNDAAEAASVLAAADAKSEGAVAATPVAVETGGAAVLGVTIERAAPTDAVAAATLARTGVDVQALLLLAAALLTAGTGMIRRSRRATITA